MLYMMLRIVLIWNSWVVIELVVICFSVLNNMGVIVYLIVSRLLIYMVDSRWNM